MKRNSLITSVSVAFAATLSVGFVNITPRVIYGEDNRVDVYQVQNPQVLEVADSTAAMILNYDLVKDGKGFAKVRTVKFGQNMNLCSDEPFYDQPTVANCSGSLVGEDLVATAGHCISSSNCSVYSFVFGFRMIDEKNFSEMIPESEIYACKEVIAREYSGAQDYALVRLDRPVINHRPLTLQKEPVQPGDAIYVVGHPSGLPTKVADGATVRFQQGAYFQANLDTYGGNSGSPVFNAATHEVVGILVRGETDFLYDSARKCTASNHCTDTNCRGEDVTNISYISEALKKGAW
ncbi:MAG: serine protease [Bdellovibrio sp.]